MEYKNSTVTFLVAVKNDIAIRHHFATNTNAINKIDALL